MGLISSRALGRRALAAVVFALATTATVARAEAPVQVAPAHSSPPSSLAPNDAASADALFESAKTAMAAGDVARACAQFAESERLDPAPGTLLNLADCNERQGKLAAALTSLEDALALLPAGDFRLAFARQRIESLRPRVPRLVLRFARAPRPDTRITRDGVTLGLATLGVALPAEPGRHTLVVSAPGRTDRVFEVLLGEGEERVVELEEGRLVAAATANAPASTRGGSRRVLGYTLVGLGGAAIVTGAVASILMMSAASTYRDHCPAQHCIDDAGRSAAETGRVTQIVTPVAFALGAAGVGFGVYFLASGKDSRGTGASIVPSAAPGGMSLSLTNHF